MHEEIIPLVCWTLEKYPESEPQDIVKLLYQREFGPAHAISDPERTLNWLKEEYASCVQEEDCPFEYIGGGYARLHLARLDANGIAPEKAADAFVKSAVPAGDKKAFAEMLTELAQDELVKELCPGLPAYIEDYIAADCPAVHHSESFREAYRPAYRVVKPELLIKR